ncbi:hypothetical protein Tco_0590617 [Tanacetum coccineum]
MTDTSYSISLNTPYRRFDTPYPTGGYGVSEHNHWCNQVAIVNALVPPEKRLNNKKCNARIEFSKPHREETYQVTLDALKLSLCYPTFLITAEVPKVYMHQFWNTIQKIKDTDAYRFKLDKKKFRVDTKVFREILQICLILPNQEFFKLPSEDELIPSIQELGYLGKCDIYQKYIQIIASAVENNFTCYHSIDSSLGRTT